MEKSMVLLSSLCRIELLIRVIMEEKYGKEEADRVYNEVTELVDKKLFDEED